MKHLLASLACGVALAATADAQLSNYLGPGILTGGADNIGNRSGEQVDLRLYASVTGIYDNGIEPVSVNSKGDLVQVSGLYGIDTSVGAYGVHSWRVAQLGLNYSGDFIHFTNDSAYDMSNQSLRLGYTYQKSRRLYFDLQGTGGTYSIALGAIAGEASATPSIINQQSLLLFDNRTYFLQAGAGMTYLLTPRASISVGGEGFTVQYQSSALVGMEGYGAHANFRYRVSRLTSIGAQYARQHFQYPNFFGQSDMNLYTALFSTQIGRLWTLSANAGAYQVNSVGLQSVALAPAIAALLGVSSTVHIFASQTWIPAGQANLTRRFKNANAFASYSRTVLPGNGVYLTSRSEQGVVGYSYSGLRKATFSMSGGYISLASLGQGIPPYRMFTAGAGITYNLTHALHAVARYDVRQQEITIAGYRATAFRATLGIAFSPGTLPLSLW